MKYIKPLFIGALLLVTFQVCAFDQIPNEPLLKNDAINHHAIAVNIGTVALGSFEASYIERLTNHVAFTAWASWYDFRGAAFRPFSEGFGPFAGFGARVHLTGSPLDYGLFVEPMVKVGFVIHPKDPVNPNGNILTRMGGSLGYSIVLAKHLLLEGSAGVEHYYLLGKLGNDADVGFRRTSFRPNAQLSLGFSW